MAHIQQTYGDYYSSETLMTEALPYINNDLQYQMAANNLFELQQEKKITMTPFAIMLQF
jgi:hypothetical protein